MAALGSMNAMFDRDYLYPDDPKFQKEYGPRGVIHSWATEEVDKTRAPKWGSVGAQKIEDTGSLTVERMKTVDLECMDASIDFIKRAQEDNTPFPRRKNDRL